MAHCGFSLSITRRLLDQSRRWAKHHSRQHLYPEEASMKDKEFVLPKERKED